MPCQSTISKKSVFFSETVRVRAALYINDYSKEEVQATWLNAADVHRIRRENRFTVEMMNRGGTISEHEYSRRGLENMTWEGTQIRRENRSAAVKAVLNGQYGQEGGHCLDEEELAKLYKGCTSQCQIAAELSALSDMRFARLIDVEFNNLNTKLYPELSCSQKAPRRRKLRRIIRIF
jgi:hypothetical protein